MTEIIGVKFKKGGKCYYFIPGNLDVHVGNHVIVKTARGDEYGTVTEGRRNIDETELKSPLKEVLRVATKNDDEIYQMRKQKEKEASASFLEGIHNNNLKMKLVDVEYAFDGSKMIFYFTSDGRVDFRQLVKDLAAVYRTRIELRQIGVRDETKTLGSYGLCGRNLCCAQFLNEFVPVSIKMAKEQGLTLNPGKISGVCGRLMCCLKYEQEAYDELNRISPKRGAEVRTPDGIGTVQNVELIQGRVRVKIENELETIMKIYKVTDVELVDKEKDKAQDIAAKAVAKKKRRNKKKNQANAEEPAEKQPQSETSEKPAKPEKQAKSAKPEKQIKSTKPEKQEKTEKPEKVSAEPDGAKADAAQEKPAKKPERRRYRRPRRKKSGGNAEKTE